MNKKTRELLRENNLLEEQLGDEYRSVLTDIVVYLRSADITFLRQERIRRDITDMFFDGEAAGRFGAGHHRTGLQIFLRRHHR